MEKNFDEMYDQVFELVDAGRTAEAMSVAQELVDHNMSNELAWGAYGHAKLAWGDIPLAVKGFEQVIAINPNNYLGYAALGQCYVESGNYDIAINSFEKAISIDSSKGDLWIEYISAIDKAYGEDAAIEKCLYAIDIVTEKTELENLLGVLYVDKAWDNTYDIPCEDGDSSIGFITLEDIKESRELCRKAKTLITLEKYNNQIERCDTCLRLCDEDQYQKIRVSNISFLIIHFFISIIVCFFLMYTIIGIPCIFIAPWATFCANRFPMYMVNFALYHGCEDPLIYNKKGAATKGAEFVADTFFNADNAGIVKAHIWVIRTRLAWYKRVIDNMKQKKEDKKLNLNNEH